MSELSIHKEVKKKLVGMEGRVCVIQRFDISGRINTTTSNEFERAMNQALRESVFIILNLSKVTLLTSLGIRIIMKTYKQCDALGGKFRIEDPSERVQNVLGSAALEEMLK